LAIRANKDIIPGSLFTGEEEVKGRTAAPFFSKLSIDVQKA
jgi:hypothetical protein